MLHSDAFVSNDANVFGFSSSSISGPCVSVQASGVAKVTKVTQSDQSASPEVGTGRGAYHHRSHEFSHS
eukprot:4030517-Pyramimonas_sp.AAC.1